MVGFCIVFSLTWLEVGGLGPSTVAKQLVDAGMQIPGFRRSGKPIETVLKRYIPTVTVLGGAIVGLIAAVADFFGVFGTGTDSNARTRRRDVSGHTPLLRRLI